MKMIVELGRGQFWCISKSEMKQMIFSAWIIGDKADNEDIEDSDEECEDYGCIVQLGRLLHEILHIDVQRPLRDKAKTDKNL